MLRVLGGVEILLSHHLSLHEEVLVDSHTALLRHRHPGLLTTSDAGQVGHLGYQGGGGRALVILGGWHDSLGLVVPGQHVDSALNKNKTELGILVLTDGHGLLNQVAVLWQLRGHALTIQDKGNLVASDEANLLDEIPVSRDVDDGVIVPRSLELPEYNIDGDSSLALRLQFVEDPCVLEGSLTGPFFLKTPFSSWTPEHKFYACTNL